MNRNAALLLLSVSVVAASPVLAKRTVLKAADAPAAVGPYVQAVMVGDTVYLSGQLPLDPATGTLVSGDIKAQTAQVLKNLAAVLKAGGLTMDDVAQTQVYMTNLEEFPAMNEVYGTFFKTPPARATVGVASLPRKASIEISLIAVKSR